MDIKIANEQVYLIKNIIESEHSTEEIKKKCFDFYADFFKNASDEIVDSTFREIKFLKGNESEKYGLLYLYFERAKDFSVIKDFFRFFEDPSYIFDIMMRLYETASDYRFSIDLFVEAIWKGWQSNKEKTEELILNLFRNHPVFGVLGVKIILSPYRGALEIDLLNIKEEKYQINAIKSICKHPHSFDKLLDLILPLRNSKHDNVRKVLIEELASKIFLVYHDKIHDQVKDSLSDNDKDREFLKPLSRALKNYHKLKNLKESINDLNPLDNEKELMDLYYRLEMEENAKMMDEAREGRGTFLEMTSKVIVVRGNSVKYDDREPMPLARIEHSTLIDASSYLNPELYERKLNNFE
ncbi:hypothetical protein [Polaribacter porphyrae]|uniref:Uncharacterized protein n=1 Tax=Polaribacter porphyrae TaxID=1137780 RepID=A0A2S7WP80_9FLAO|nr:hypothetical protein [Polaribacter porphyrae]PQJ79394.1 hypothetical protein BTO18_09510 [Polaribacter porphyrae]